MPRKSKGASGVQARVHDFVKRLHPNVLRIPLQSIRNFVKATSGEKRSRKEELVSSQPSSSPNAVDSSLNSRIKRENLNLPVGHRTKGRVARPVDNFSADHAVVELKSKPSEMDVSVPDVVIQKDNEKSTRSESPARCEASSSGSNLQLLVEMENPPRNKSPVTVQEWVDSLPANPEDTSREDCDTSATVSAPVADTETDTLTLGAEAGCLCDSKQIEPLPLPPVNVTITSCREPSEVESHCSSVDSLLEARKPDPEEILLSLGFGGTASASDLETGRIPKRFLNKSQMKGVDIDEFIRQQQDLIYTYESGYYGYRGLAGSPHSNPSVIVAKILEKLRDHEKGTALMNCFPPDIGKLSLADQSSENESKKFSKVARNVLTKIKCTPPSSVLSPDNRRWLDSQGKKSPEINRRLILGQKSFTFGNDGALIESSTPESNERVAGDTSSAAAEADDTTPVNEATFDLRCENVANDDRVATVKCDWGGLLNKLQPAKHPPTQKASSLENIDESSENTFKKETTIRENHESHSNKRLNDVDAYSSTSAERFKFAVSLPECESGAIAALDNKVSMLENCLERNPSIETDHSSCKKTRNVLTRCSSFEESIRSSSDDEVLLMPSDNVAPMNNVPPTAEKFDQFSDSATESEFASYPDRTPLSKNIHKQYEELSQLESKLRNIGQPIPIISESQFASISAEQRTALQLSIIRKALKIYLHELTKDEIDLELKKCLTNEVQKVTDLLDSSSDSSKLCVIVRQMTLLLQHQSQLSAQMREVSNVGNRPSSCHEMCDHILRRVQELESLVERNAQELAQMKYELLNKK